ncbi:Sad1 and UNC84 domain containing 2 [Homo sapiens]|uniref:Isoform 2 of SUN domain-containing protein 2 n=1 Tax=Homo sapiens TaxID=9606 RepID=Q9UH99-2|nr:SUN domain-containing protein 2 isoform 1 [Homo sapiens]NP_001381357.1 SUN domain-containing protein 2 isoform 1 [Homo sapiens]KAI2597860.1 Sad1 and UNC84 domain containing 2 [Homo sapiens]KAI4003040.1 Sad1 and UNC84 domain containing 2 [Homo sapiens]|eukprot:NP_001186508.1 SUN domain-containing protein 2 isoform a [Homo sapiens]
MSRRSQRLTRYSQGDDDGSSSSGGSSVAGSQSTLFKDSPLRTLKRKSSNMKRLSPAPQLGPSSDAHTSYYSESLVHESWFPPRSSLEELHGDANWGEDLRVRRRRGTGGSESSRASGLVGRKATEDFLGSSSGYSSEDDYVEDSEGRGSKVTETEPVSSFPAGYSDVDQQSSSSRLRSAVSRAGSLLWMVATSPGRLFRLLYWWAGTTWYRLTTAASLLDVFVLTRRFSSLKTFLWFLLPLLLLTCLTYGAWYFYPYGLQTFHPALVSWWAAKDSRRPDEGWEARDSSPHFQAEQRVMSRVHSLERRLEALAAEFSSNWQKEAMRLERLELRQGAPGQGGGGGLSHEDTLALLEGLVSRREAALKEDFRRETAARIQEELSALRAEHQQDSEDLFKKIVRASQESEARIQQLKSEWQSMTQESFQESSVKELRRLEDQLAGLQQELAALALKQSSVAEEVGLLPQQIQAVRDDVESQFPAWISQFLARGGGGRVGLLQREEMQAQLRELESKILTHVAEMQGKSAREAAASLSLTLQKEGVIGVTEEQVHHIVKQALQRYSEDRIGLADYALESGGASVISTRCSETYETKTALLSLFGIPLWYHSQSPRVILQPDVHPGNCWAFQGPQGFAVVRLSARIRPTAVTLEHVPKALSPNSTISSAPKDFAIFGFDEDLQQEGTLLGKFTYDQDGEPIQTFHFQAPTMATYQVVELRILTNWGHPEYTCIYRFRVHGEPAH